MLPRLLHIFGNLSHMCPTRLKISQGVVYLQERVRNAPISGNMDSPEGGFDALMQAIVCRDEIGWRDQARRIIIFSTDAKFHHAGDGRVSQVSLTDG